LEGQGITRTMTSTSMMAIVGLLEKISASKAEAEKRARDVKDAVQRVMKPFFIALMTCVANTLQFQKVDESRIGSRAIHMASPGGTGAKRTHDEIIPDSEEDCPSPRLKRRRRNEHDEEYDGIFELLKKAEVRSERMEMCAIENQQAAFEQAEKALISFNALSERLLHAIVNIGGSDV
jgi:hypothetical protein